MLHSLLKMQIAIALLVSAMAIIYCISTNTVFAQHSQARTLNSHAVESTLSDSASCLHAFAYGESAVADGYFSQAVDTLESFIGSCHDQKYSYQAFPQLDAAVASMQSTSSVKWLLFRDWLFKVLYLSRDTNYYCYDVDDLVASFNYFDGPRGEDTKGRIAVEKYIVNSGKCPMLDYEYNRNFIPQWRIA